MFTRIEMYTMAPTNVQPVTRYFSQQDKMRMSYSRYYISAIRGSKIGYTNTARYSYVCLAEQNGVRLICVTMQSELKTDKYNDVRTLLDYAFARYTGYTDLPAQGITGQVEVVGGGGSAWHRDRLRPRRPAAAGQRRDCGRCGGDAGTAGKIRSGSPPGSVRCVHRQRRR